MSGGLDVLKLTVSIICIVVFYVLSHIFKYPICVNRFLSDLCISDYCLRPIILVARPPPLLSILYMTIFYQKISTHI